MLRSGSAVGAVLTHLGKAGADGRDEKNRREAWKTVKWKNGTAVSRKQIKRR